MTKKKYDKTFQRLLICGRLAKDPEITFIGSGKAVCNFGLIVNDENGSDYIPCVAWGEKAKRISDNVTKGALIQCEGKIKSSSYKDAENRNQFKVQFELLPYGLLLFLDSKKPDLTGLDELPEMEGDS